MKTIEMLACVALFGGAVSGCATPQPEKVPAGWNEANKLCKQLQITAGVGTNGPGPAQVYYDCMKRKGFDT